MTPVKSVQRISKSFPDGSDNPNFKVEERIYLDGRDGHSVDFSKIKVILTVPNFAALGNTSRNNNILPRGIQVFATISAIQVNLIVYNVKYNEWPRKFSVEIIEYY